MLSECKYNFPHRNRGLFVFFYSMWYHKSIIILYNTSMWNAERNNWGHWNWWDTPIHKVPHLSLVPSSFQPLWEVAAIAPEISAAIQRILDQKNRGSMSVRYEELY